MGAPVLSSDKSAIHGMETSSVSHRQKIQDINQLWETDGDCVLGHTWCESVALTLPNETVNSAAYQATLKKLRESCSTQDASDVRQEGPAVA